MIERSLLLQFDSYEAEDVRCKDPDGMPIVLPASLFDRRLERGARILLSATVAPERDTDEKHALNEFLQGM